MHSQLECKSIQMDKKTQTEEKHTLIGPGEEGRSSTSRKGREKERRKAREVGERRRRGKRIQRLEGEGMSEGGEKYS